MTSSADRTERDGAEEAWERFIHPNGLRRPESPGIKQAYLAGYNASRDAAATRVGELEAENEKLRHIPGSWMDHAISPAEREKQLAWEDHDTTAVCSVCKAPLLIHYEVSADPGRWRQSYKRAEEVRIAEMEALSHGAGVWLSRDEAATIDDALRHVEHAGWARPSAGLPEIRARLRAALAVTEVPDAKVE